jgi:hypothetical protein
VEEVVMSTMRIRGVTALLLIAIMLAASACTGATFTVSASADDRATRCGRDGGVWRAQIADGYCEIKP